MESILEWVHYLGTTLWWFWPLADIILTGPLIFLVIKNIRLSRKMNAISAEMTARTDELTNNVAEWNHLNTVLEAICWQAFSLRGIPLAYLILHQTGQFTAVRFKEVIEDDQD